jgi:hypothetical protein
MQVHATVKELLDILGPEALTQFAMRYGGTRVYIPQPHFLKPGHDLSRVVGYELAVKLAREWRGVEMAVPRCLSLVVALRDEKIRAEAPFTTLREQVHKYGLTERTISYIRAGGRPSRRS